MRTRCIRMARKAGNQIEADDFELVERDLPAPAAGEVLTATRFFSLDPYLSMRMRSWQSPEPDFSLGWHEGRVIGPTLGEVIDSNDPRFKAGDWVAGTGGWQDFDVRRADNLRRVDNVGLPMQMHLSGLGSSGVTAWVGVTQVLKPRAGETATVSSAAGIVGSIAGQILRAQGCRVVGIAGGAEKCAGVVRDFGFDACIDYRSPDFAESLARALPKGIDKHFENVGASMLDAVLPLMRDHAHIALCGLISHYQDDKPIALRFFRELLMRAITLQGFRTADYLPLHEQARAELAAWIKSGTIRVNETVTNGLENAPVAYVGMLNGGGSGKHLVRL